MKKSSLVLVVVVLLLGYVSCKCNRMVSTDDRYRNIENCAISRVFRPVCGSDGCKYINGDALICAQNQDRAQGKSEDLVVKEADDELCEDNDTTTGNTIITEADNGTTVLTTTADTTD
ncbi:uncharacterized protein LOC121855162 isoform X2 [Homarus americanus]|nr:uncharacterized protein LOC121855162 isoform X2 [Homarus americanus]